MRSSLTASADRGRRRTIVAILSEDIGYDATRKRMFRAEASRLLKQLAGVLGLGKADYDLRWNGRGCRGRFDAPLLCSKG